MTASTPRLVPTTSTPYEWRRMETPRRLLARRIHLGVGLTGIADLEVKAANSLPMGRLAFTLCQVVDDGN